MTERIEFEQQFERLANVLAETASEIGISVTDMVEIGDTVLLLYYPKLLQPFDKTGKLYGVERLVIPQIVVDTSEGLVQNIYAWDGLPYKKASFDLVLADQDFSEYVVSVGKTEYEFSAFFNIVAEVLKPSGKAYFYPL